MLGTKELTNTAWTPINSDYAGSWHDLQQPDTGISGNNVVCQLDATR